MSLTVNMHDAKTTLSKLVDQAIAGEEVIIAKAGVPLVKLIPVQHIDAPRKPGRFKGQIVIAPDFDITPEEIVAAFEGDSE